MNKIFLALVLAVLVACNSEEKSSEKTKEIMNTEEITTYYFIRHAEKDTSDRSEKDPELAEPGKERARKWAEVFKEVDFDIIYSSDFKRTRNTAKPIAESKRREIQLYDSSKLNDEDFQLNTKGKTVLVVGHMDTNPKWINYILGEEKYQTIDEEESGSLFIITALPDGTKNSQVLYIN